MKLSVKWLAGLAVLALAVVAVVSSTSQSQAATGVIYVANTGQQLTTEPGQTIANNGFDSTTTLWATYAADLSSGEPLRLIRSNTVASTNTPGDAADADLVKVIIIDTGRDIAQTVFDGVGAQTLNLAAPFNTTVITITNPGTSPIANPASAIKIYIDNDDDGTVDVGDTQIAGPGTTALNLQATVLSVNALGSAINVQSEVSGGGTPDIIVEYQTSVEDTLQNGQDPDGPGGLAPISVVVKSDIDNQVGRGLWLEEVNRSGGRFEGYVRLTDQNGGGVGNDGLAQADATGPDAAGAAVIRVASGPLTIQFVDSSGATRLASVQIDTSAPVPSVTAPAHNSATINQTPVFSGSVNEAGSGLDISEIDLVIDTVAEANANDNDIPVISDAGANNGIAQSINKTGALDGDPVFSFSFTPSVALPTGLPGGTFPDHLVDFQIRAADRSGNLGFSDADGNAAADGGTASQGVGSGTARFDAHIVKIDRVAPVLSIAQGDNETGVRLDAANTEIAGSNSLRVTFNDSVQGADPADFTVTFPSSNTAHIPTSVQTKGAAVYLTLAVSIPPGERPKVDLQGSVTDSAGNTTLTGTTNVADGIAPTLTVTLSGGTGSGTGSEGPAGLTSDKMTITITSNEPLALPPGVDIHQVGGGNPLETSPTALAFGTNTWVATYNAGVTGDRAVVVDGNDSAGSGTTPNLGNNTATSGAAGTKSFRVDQELANPTEVPGDGAVTFQTRPFLTFNFGAGGETATVTITEITLDGVNVTAQLVAGSDNKRFFVLPSADLSIGDHTLVIPATKAKDAAGNVNSSAISMTFEVEPRATFDIGIFAGWNALSFPSDPVDPDINSVFTNPGHDAVLGFDPTVPGQWRIATRDEVSGELETTTANGLNSVRSTQAYWVHSNNFEGVSALLVGETLPDSGSVPSIPQIATVLGFNAVPVVDADRKQTTGDLTDVTLMRNTPGGDAPVTIADYLGSVTEGRVYQWNPETLTFEALDGNDAVKLGKVLFVEVVGTATPIFP